MFVWFRNCQVFNKLRRITQPKHIRYLGIIWSRIVGWIVAQYSTRPRVEYLSFRWIWWILVESSRIEPRYSQFYYLTTTRLRTQPWAIASLTNIESVPLFAEVCFRAILFEKVKNWRKKCGKEQIRLPNSRKRQILTRNVVKISLSVQTKMPHCK